MTTIKAWSYDDKAIREDLLDVLTNIDPTENNLQNDFGTSTARGVLHEWPTDVLDAVGDNAQVESADAPAAAHNNPTRINNLAQIFAKAGTISGTERAVNTAGFSDRLTYEVEKKMKSLKNDIEYAVLRGSGTTGDGTTTARRLKGVRNFISTNATAQSGVSLTEAILVSYLSNAWTKGGRVDTIYVGPTLKNRIDGFSGNSTRYIGADEKSLVNTINLYSSSYGAETIKVKLHRYMDGQSGDVNSTVMGLQTDLWNVAYLRKPFRKDLAPTGDADKFELITELTIESRAEQGNFMGQKHT